MLGDFGNEILLLMLLIQYSTAQAISCQSTMKAVKDSVLILSDELTSANTARKRCSSLGGNLAMTDDPQINTTLTQLMTEKYTTGLKRVWIFYDSVEPIRYRYSYDPTETDYWRSSKQLGHLYYLDLFTSSNASYPSVEVFFCLAPNSGRKKWNLRAGRDCEVNTPDWNGWRLQFSLFARRKTKGGYQTIFTFYNYLHSAMLRKVNETYNTFDQPKKLFYAPSINVLIGARYKMSLHGWYWGDGSQANFPVSNVTTCQQGALHYGIGWEQSSMKCSGELAYYACQVKLFGAAKNFPCNASTVMVSWTGLDRFINTHNLTAQVEIHILELKWRRNVPYADLSTSIGNLSYSTNYNIRLTAMLTGCQTLNVTSSLAVTTFGNPPPSCYPPVVSSVKTFPCNASTVVVSWTGLDQFINSNKLNTQVEIHVLEMKKQFLLSYSSYSAAIGNLNSSTNYNVQVTVFITGSITTNITSNLTVTTPGNPPTSCMPAGFSLATAAGVIAGMLILVILILAILVLRRRRRSHTTTVSRSLDTRASNRQSLQREPEDVNGVYQNLTFDTETAENNNTAGKLFDIYRKNAESGFALLTKEFQIMENESKVNQHTREVSQLPQNASKNRYKNIFPYDHARVVLQGTGGNDYINAAYIPGYDNERKFIATQGPKKETINDFWWMVWQENSNIIIMLTGLRENGKAKCEKYWPEVGSQSKLSSNLQILTQQEINAGGIIQRQLLLSGMEEQRSITQLQYTTWPDHGIPVTTSNMIYLRNMVDNLHHTNAPIIVHCSAGVGRTGTYIAMDTLFHELDDKGTVDVPRTVLRMREYRIDMIQNAKQYMYVYKLLTEHESLVETDKDVTELQSMTSAEINKMLEKEYKMLSTWRYGEKWLGGSPELITYKNTSIGVWDDGIQAIQHVDASSIQEHGSSEFFIAARSPEPGKEEIFWKMVATRSASLVVDLNQSIQVSLNEALHYGDVAVTVREENESKLQSVVTFAISSLTNSFTEQKLTLLQVKEWNDAERPPDEMDFVKLIETMQRLKIEQNSKCVLVCCSNGKTRTGTFIALVNILERLKAQKRVDVFRTVKDLRDMRPNMLDKKILYKYCYSVVKKYLSDFSTYSNFK